MPFPLPLSLRFSFRSDFHSGVERRHARSLSRFRTDSRDAQRALKDGGAFSSFSTLFDGRKRERDAIGLFPARCLSLHTARIACCLLQRIETNCLCLLILCDDRNTYIRTGPQKSSKRCEESCALFLVDVDRFFDTHPKKISKQKTFRTTPPPTRPTSPSSRQRSASPTPSSSRGSWACSAATSLPEGSRPASSRRWRAGT